MGNSALLGIVRLDGDAGMLLRLDAPHCRNALSGELVAALQAELDAAASQGSQLVALSGGKECFSSGFDLSGAGSTSHADLKSRFLAIQDLLDSLRQAPFLTVALVDGPAVGAGADLVAACDVRIGSARATFRFPGLNFGVLLGTDRLISLVGSGMALRLLLQQESLSATQAADSGLLTHVLPSNQFPVQLSELATRVASIDPDTMRGLVNLLRRRDDREARDVLAESIGVVGLPERIQAFLSMAGDRPRSD